MALASTPGPSTKKAEPKSRAMWPLRVLRSCAGSSLGRNEFCAFFAQKSTAMGSHAWPGQVSVCLTCHSPHRRACNVGPGSIPAIAGVNSHRRGAVGTYHGVTLTLPRSPYFRAADVFQTRRRSGTGNRSKRCLPVASHPGRVFRCKVRCAHRLCGRGISTLRPNAPYSVARSGKNPCAATLRHTAFPVYHAQKTASRLRDHQITGYQQAP